MTPLSRTLRIEDYGHLRPEMRELDAVQDAIGPSRSLQHPNRRWEYCLGLKALREVHGSKRNLLVADFGCGVGLLSPMLLSVGHQVSMYDDWSMEPFAASFDAVAQMTKTQHAFGIYSGRHGCHAIGLGSLTSTDCGYDAAFCVSVLEHVADEDAAFDDLCRSVASSGLLFLTVDFGPMSDDMFEFRRLRQRIYTEARMYGLADRAAKFGMKLLGGDADWSWHGPAVFDYSFAALAMRRAA